MDQYFPHSRGNFMDYLNKNRLNEDVPEKGGESEVRMVSETPMACDIANDGKNAVVLVERLPWDVLERSTPSKTPAASAGVDSGDSDWSVQTTASTRSTKTASRFWKTGNGRKRQKCVSPLALSSDGDEEVRASPIPPNQFLAQKQEVSSLRAEIEIEEMAQAVRANRAALGFERMDKESDARTAVALTKLVHDDVDIILNVATRSRNLKGTFQRALKDAAASIKTVVEVLHNRTSNEETAKLQADNERLQMEVSALRRELKDFRNEVEQVQKGRVPQPPAQMDVLNPLARLDGGLVEELTRSIMVQVGGMLNARLKALDERLLPDKRLRPSLAADQRHVVVPISPKPQSVAGGSGNTADPQKKNKGKKAGKPKAAGVATGSPTNKEAKQNQSDSRTLARGPQKAESLSLPPAPKSVDEEWSTVVRRRGRITAVSKPVMATQPKTRPAKLRAPRSAAVVITLQPGAEEKGVTYAKVLADARKKVDLASCGITGLRYRKAATGARMLEVPGATSGEKADTLARKLRESLDAELVKVSRPVKSAELRISGLDDSISTPELAAAVATHGCCPVESVKVGEIRIDNQGSGAVWLRCPVAAAKKLEASGRLLVGWVAARVKLLQPRPMQCYRCLQKGHVHAQCTAEVDRSEECYRCGRPGHKAASCTAEPKCSLCAAANRPAGHRMGSKSCSPPKPKNGAKVAAAAVALAATSCPPSQTGEGEAMVIN